MAEKSGTPEQRQYPPEAYAYADRGNLNRAWYGMGLVTKNSETTKSGSEERVQRPLSLRAKRAEMWYEYKLARKKGDQETMGAMHQKALLWDEVYEQFFNHQQDLEVDLGEMGTTKVKWTSVGIDDKNREPPIVLLPGISNSLEGLGEIPLVMAIMTKRKVLMLSWPEAEKSETTEEFAKAVESDKGLGPHVKFTKEAIKKMLPEGKFEIWGQSLGGAVAGLIVGDEELNDRITGLVMISPPGLIKQDEATISLALANEGVEIGKNLKASLRINPANKEIISTTKEAVARKERIFQEVKKRALGEINWGNEKLKLVNGGKILVVSGKNDAVAGTKKGAEKLQQLGIDVLEIGGGHITPLLRPEEVVGKIVGRMAEK